jgi:LmbE family N-acetylglucosaminyl deacetylase
MLLEPDLVPYSVSMPVGERVVVLAPHPDDETLGMGGTIRLLTESKKHVKVIFLTNGDKADPSNKLSQIVHSENPPHPSLLKGGKEGLLNESHITEYALLREKEAVKALRILGVSEYEFLGFPDRELLGNKDRLEKAVRRIIDDFRPDMMYSPSIIELNPDHRAAAELSISINMGTSNPGCIFYEITTPIRPNMLVDITKVFKYKKNALKCYKSQLKITDYLRLMEGFNAYRSLTLGRGVKFAEAFWQVGSIKSKEDMKMWLSYEIPIML